MRISDWSSDVCSSDLAPVRSAAGAANYFAKDDYYTVEGSSEVSLWAGEGATDLGLSGEVTKDGFEAILNGSLPEIGRASCRERVCQYVYISVVAVSLKKKI